MRSFPFRLFLFGSVVLLSVGAIAASGLTALSIDRQVEATVVADNADAAVKLECINNSGSGGPDYSDVCQYTNGVVTLQLHNALGDGATGFNPDALFTVGGSAAGKRVLKITNNSGIAIKVWLEDTDGHADGGITMKNESATAVTSAETAQVIAIGASHQFYFEVDTPASTDALSAKLHIEQQ